MVTLYLRNYARVVSVFVGRMVREGRNVSMTTADDYWETKGRILSSVLCRGSSGEITRVFVKDPLAYRHDKEKTTLRAG